MCVFVAFAPIGGSCLVSSGLEPNPNPNPNPSPNPKPKPKEVLFCKGSWFVRLTLTLLCKACSLLRIERVTEDVFGIAEGPTITVNMCTFVCDLRICLARSTTM
jgi:hypothetical protein